MVKRNTQTKIIEWRINEHHATIWVKDDHTGYILFCDRARIGDFEFLKDACNEMNKQLEVKI